MRAVTTGVKGLSLCANDLKERLERPDLEFRAGLAVCTSAETFPDDVLAAFHRAQDATEMERVRTVFLMFLLGDELSKTLSPHHVNMTAERVMAAVPAHCDLCLHTLMDEHLDGGLCVLAVGVPRIEIKE